MALTRLPVAPTRFMRSLAKGPSNFVTPSVQGVTVSMVAAGIASNIARSNSATPSPLVRLIRPETVTMTGPSGRARLCARADPVTDQPPSGAAPISNATAKPAIQGRNGPPKATRRASNASTFITVSPCPRPRPPWAEVCSPTEALVA